MEQGAVLRNRENFLGVRVLLFQQRRKASTAVRASGLPRKL